MMSLCLPGPGLWRACVLVCSPALSCLALGRGVPACSSAALLCPAWPWAVAWLHAPPWAVAHLRALLCPERPLHVRGTRQVFMVHHHPFNW